MLTVMINGALAAAVLLSGLPPADSPVQPDATSVATATVVSDVKTMPHFWASVSFGELRCPDHAPFLEDHHYYTGLPAGIGAITSGDEVDVASMTRYHPVHRGRPIGIAYATATNWAVPTASRDVQLIAFCVAN